MAFRFHLLESKRKHKHRGKKKEKFWFLCSCLRFCLWLRQGLFHGEIRIIVFAFVLASLVKTRLTDVHAKISSPQVLLSFYCSEILVSEMQKNNWG